MKPPVIPPTVIALLIGMLAALVGCATRARNIELYGDPVPPADNQPTIVITPATRHVNVTGGDTIRFIADGKQFAWTFNVARTIGHFDLNEIAPPGMLDHPVRAYVSPDPRYLGLP